MTLEELGKKVKDLESQIRIIQDIEEIKKLNRAYGYYIEHGMHQELIDLFSDGPDVSCDFFEEVVENSGGTYVGKKGVSTMFNDFKDRGPEFLHQIMLLSPIIDVAPDGQSAQGRWYGYGGFAMPAGSGVKESIISGIYENEYVKENGKWKFKTLRFKLTYFSTPGEGFVKPERIAAAADAEEFNVSKPDFPPKNFDPAYPSGYIFPFHFKHPVTGEETSEGKRNASIEGIKGKYDRYENIVASARRSS